MRMSAWPELLKLKFNYRFTDLCSLVFLRFLSLNTRFHRVLIFFFVPENCENKAASSRSVCKARLSLVRYVMC